MTNDLISRSALLEYFKTRLADFIDDYGKGWVGGIKAAISIVEKFPAVDSVEVVRCRDCNYFYNEVSNKTYCKLSLCQVNEDDYCRDGERKNNATDRC